MLTKWTRKATGTPGGMVADADELRRGLKLFADPDAGCEIMALKSGQHKTLSGSDINGLVDAAENMPAGIGLYIRLNPCPASLSNPATNADILKRRWLYIDIDPFKAIGQEDNPATQQEKVKAGEVAERVLEKLSGAGWPAPIIMDSGNGWALFYRVDLPNSVIAKSVIARLMKALSDEFSGSDGIVDKSVHNANRLTKLPGTWAKKGTETPERPYRVCRILSVPSELIVLELEQIESVAGIESREPVPAPTPSTNGVHDKFTLRATAGGKGAYGRAALDKECARVSLAGSGNRNNALNEAAFSLGQLVAGGELERNEVEARLTLAALSAGLDNSEITTTLRSGLNAGMKLPRIAPEKPGTQPAKSLAPLAENEPLTVCAANVQPLRVAWLWPDRVPKKFVTVFAGRTGLGKSFVTCDMIARVSRGAEIPFSNGETFERGGTLFISEDPHEYMLAPRLIELGADMRYIQFMRWEVMARYALADTDMLDRACREVREPKLVVIDPPTNFLGDADEHKNSEVRATLMKLVTWVQTVDVACVLIMHVNKQTGKGVEALNRVLGSVAWVSTSRIAHSFSPDPNDSDKRLFVPMKNNLGKVACGLAYQILPTDSLARVDWLAEVDISADEAMNEKSQTQKRGVIASEWLIEKFKEKKEWDSETLFKMASEEGISRGAMFEAKKTLCLPRARRNIGENGSVIFSWWVPDDWPPLGGPKQEGIPL